jgi:hypothetical protein
MQRQFSRWALSVFLGIVAARTYDIRVKFHEAQ